jgi:hypothetical protein
LDCLFLLELEYLYSLDRAYVQWLVCLGMVVVAGKKDDQTETIEQLNQTISEQSRRIMNTEGQLARYKRELAEATGKNEA